MVDEMDLPEAFSSTSSSYKKNSKTPRKNTVSQPDPSSLYKKIKCLKDPAVLNQNDSYS